MEINNKTYEQYKAIIQCTKFSTKKNNGLKRNHSFVSKKRTGEIKRFFKEYADLDLEAIQNSERTTWEKTMQLAIFVAKNIPHDNQKKNIKKKNAITLWKYSREVTTGFNCRWHAILLSELLLAIGIKNTFVTCLPEDRNDGDCHVVNLVWLPETWSWAMIDSDMTEYVVDENEKPLSLKEMREYICNNRDFCVRVLPGFENSWIASTDGLEYMKCYWAKNLYWFAKHTLCGYGLESSFHISDAYLCLVPSGYHFDRNKFTGIEVTNDIVFWD